MNPILPRRLGIRLRRLHCTQTINRIGVQLILPLITRYQRRLQDRLLYIRTICTSHSRADITSALVNTRFTAMEVIFRHARVFLAGLKVEFSEDFIHLGGDGGGVAEVSWGDGGFRASQKDSPLTISAIP